MKRDRYNTLLNSPLFKESVENEEDFKEDTALDSEEIIGEDLSYLDEIDEEDDEPADDEEDTDEDEDFDDEDEFGDDSEEGFDDDEEFDDESSDEEFEDDGFEDGEGTDEFEDGGEVGGDAPQLTANQYDGGKTEEEPKMYYHSEDEVTLEVLEETGNGAVGDEPALTAMEQETPEVASVEAGESQTTLAEIPEEFNFEGTYDAEDEFTFDNGFGVDLEVSEEGTEDDFDGEGDDFGDEEGTDDEEFEGDDEFEDEDSEEGFDDEEEFDDEEADTADFGDDDLGAEDDDEDFDIDTDYDEEDDEEFDED